MSAEVRTDELQNVYSSSYGRVMRLKYKNGWDKLQRSTARRVMNYELIRIIRRLVRAIGGKLQYICSTKGKIQILVRIIRRLEKSLFN